MVKQNQGFRRDFNLLENVNDSQTLNNLAGPGIADDLRILQNNLRNISRLDYNSLSNNYFFFGEESVFVFTNDDIISVSEDVGVGNTTLFKDRDYFICNSNGKNQFKISETPSTIGINTVNVTSVSTSDFYFIRKDSVTSDNIFNFLRPDTLDKDFNYLEDATSINSTIENIQDNIEIADYLVKYKYKGNEDVIVNDEISIEGTVKIDDPSKLNTGDSGLANPKSPGVFINSVRAFSSDNNPWTKDGTELKTNSNSVSIGELYFGDEINISGISTETASQVPVTSFSHKLPVTINGETYYILLST